MLYVPGSRLEFTSNAMTVIPTPLTCIYALFSSSHLNTTTHTQVFFLFSRFCTIFIRKGRRTLYTITKAGRRVGQNCKEFKYGCRIIYRRHVLYVPFKPCMGVSQLKVWRTRQREIKGTKDEKKTNQSIGGERYCTVHLTIDA
jgi:hypothetical protein